MTRLIGRAALVLLAGVACVPARADDPPLRKPGLWLITRERSGAQAPVRETRMCIDAATDAEMLRMGAGAAQGLCSRNEVKRDGNRMTVTAVCNIGKTQSYTQAVTTFTGDTAFHTDIAIRFDPPMNGRGDSSMTQDGKWIGPCPADMRPGDIEGPGGVKMNLKSLLDMAKRLTP